MIQGLDERNLIYLELKVEDMNRILFPWIN